VDVSEAWEAGPALPFAQGRKQPSAPPASQPPAAPGATQDVGDAWQSGAALPFSKGSAAPAAPRYSLEQYASLVVEIADAPARVAETLVRYGLSVAAKEGLDAEWRARLADEGQRAAFDRACAAYRAWLKGQAR
jgi:hypothetical protein